MGVVHCHEELLRRKVQEIKDDRNAYWLGMGDYADLITPSDFKRWDGRILAPWMRNKERNIGPTQVEKVDEILSPIWHKCVGLIEGNHDEGIAKHHHYDFMEELLKLANKKTSVPYAGVSCFLAMRFKRKNSSEVHEFRIHARHGEGSARTEGARALAVLRLSSSTTNTHVTLMGHLHGQSSPDIPQRLLFERGKVKAFDSFATMTGAWLRAYMQSAPASYLERWGCPPSKLGCPKIVFYPDEGEMELVKRSTSRVV